MAGVRNPPKPVVAKVYYVLYPRSLDGTPILADNWDKTVAWDHFPTDTELANEVEDDCIDDVVLLKVEGVAQLKSTITVGGFK